MKRIIPVLLAGFMLLGLVLGGCAGSSSGTTPTGKSVSTSVQVGKAAPDFQLEAPDGKKVSLSSFRGKPVLINFWATWCGPCVGEMPLLQEVYSEYSGKGLVLLAVNSGETAARVTGFMQRYEFTFPVFLDTNNEIAAIYNIKYLPTTFLVDKDGILLRVTVGSFENKAAIMQMVSEVLPAK